MIELNKIYNMDCIEGMKLLEDNSIDSIVTDPPYELGFMGKKWDASGIAYNAEMWKEAFRVLKPGGHLLSFGGTRTYHRMACAIEDAGFEIRDQIQWVYGSGFPKSLNIGKSIDKLQGNEREIIGYKEPFGREGRNTKPTGNYNASVGGNYTLQRDLRPIYKDCNEFEGWGTALKPAHEPIVVARKPLAEKSVAENVLKYGTGGINIDECRIPTIPRKTGTKPKDDIPCGSGNSLMGSSKNRQAEYDLQVEQGRFPSNFIHDGSEEVLELFPSDKGAFAPVKSGQKGFGGVIYGKYNQAGDDGKTFYNDGLGSAARFFYCAKASKSERNEGCDNIRSKEYFINRTPFERCRKCNKRKGFVGYEGCVCEQPDFYPEEMKSNTSKNNHPTVKPLKLMQYLVRLVTPKNGIVLDSFMGSGTTGMAAKSQGFRYIGFDMTKEYCEIAEVRIKATPFQKKIGDI